MKLPRLWESEREITRAYKHVKYDGNRRHLQTGRSSPPFLRLVSTSRFHVSFLRSRARQRPNVNATNKDAY